MLTVSGAGTVYTYPNPLERDGTATLRYVSDRGNDYLHCGGSGGITCADGSTATLARATPDGTWTYAHSESGSAWSTTITDPQNNQTAMQFQGIYETQRKSYQGSTAGTLLATVDTCYNGSASPCTGTALTAAITQISAITSLSGPAVMQSKTVNFFNAYGLSTETDQYDFGSGAPGGLLRKSVVTYNTALTNGIVDHPAMVQVSTGVGC